MCFCFVVLLFVAFVFNGIIVIVLESVYELCGLHKVIENFCACLCAPRTLCLISSSFLHKGVIGWWTDTNEWNVCTWSFVIVRSIRLFHCYCVRHPRFSRLFTPEHRHDKFSMQFSCTATVHLHCTALTVIACEIRTIYGHFRNVHSCV